MILGNEKLGKIEAKLGLIFDGKCGIIKARKVLENYGEIFD